MSRGGRVVATVIVFGVLLALIALAVLLPLLADTTSPGALLLGYVAIALSNAVSTFTIPTPGLSVLGQGLIAWYGADHVPVIAGLIGGTAMAIGQIPSYALGAVAMDSVQDRIAGRPRLEARVDDVIASVERRGWVAVSLLSLIPNPFTLFGDMAAGYSGMPFRTFFLAAWIARVIRALIIAFLGAAFLETLVE